jgi:hypothetical protein
MNEFFRALNVSKKRFDRIPPVINLKSIENRHFSYQHSGGISQLPISGAAI